MFDELLQWFPPGQRDLFASVLTDIYSRLQAVEDKQAPAAAVQAPVAPAK